MDLIQPTRQELITALSNLTGISSSIIEERLAKWTQYEIDSVICHQNVQAQLRKMHGD